MSSTGPRATTMAAEKQIQAELLPFAPLQSYIKRLKAVVVPPGTDAETGVTSRDVDILPANGVSARLFLPPEPTKKLPILVYFHGGGFLQN